MVPQNHSSNNTILECTDFVEGGKKKLSIIKYHGLDRQLHQSPNLFLQLWLSKCLWVRKQERSPKTVGPDLLEAKMGVKNDSDEGLGQSFHLSTDSM